MAKNSAQKLINDFPVQALDELAKEKGYSARELLKDEDKMQKFVDSLPSKLKGAVKQKIWEVFSVLPVSTDIQDNIRSRILKVQELDRDKEEVQQKTSVDSLDSWTIVPTYLPFGNFPKADTYLSTTESSVLELPKAKILIYKADGSYEDIELNEVETAASLRYAMYKNDIIKKNRKKYEEEYKEDYGLLESAKPNFLDVRKYWLRKLLKSRLIELANGYLNKANHIDPTDKIKIEIRFSQNRKQPTKELLKKVLEIDEKQINSYLLSLLGEVDIQIPSEEKEPETGEMIPLSAIKPFLGQGSYEWEELNEEPSYEKLGKYSKGKERTKDKMNELQKVHVQIVHATKSGNWHEAIRLYIKYLDYWPQYLEHRIGVLDLINKYESGEIPELPKNILSIASGPHEELRAHYDIQQITPGYQLPRIVNLDLFQKMLDVSRKTLPDGIKDRGEDIEGDMREIDNVILDDGYDLIECSSFDNLKDDNEKKSVILQGIGKLKVNGLIRFYTHEAFTDEFCEILKRHGINVLDNEKKPTLTKEIKERIKTEMGVNVANRCCQKLKRLFYFFAIVDKEIDIEKLAEDLKNINLFKPKKSLSANELKKRVTKNLEQDINDLNESVAVAINAPYFLKHKNLAPEVLEKILINMKGKVNFGVAVKLYKVFFIDESRDLLAPFVHLVFDIASEFVNIKNYFSKKLLEHPNPKVREKISEYIQDENFLHLENVIKERDFKLLKEEVIKLMDRHSLKEIIEYLVKQGVREDQIESLAKHILEEKGDEINKEDFGFIFNNILKPEEFIAYFYFLFKLFEDYDEFERIEELLEVLPKDTKLLLPSRIKAKNIKEIDPNNINKPDLKRIFLEKYNDIDVRTRILAPFIELTIKEKNFDWVMLILDELKNKEEPIYKKEVIKLLEFIKGEFVFNLDIIGNNLKIFIEIADLALIYLTENAQEYVIDLFEIIKKETNIYNLGRKIQEEVRSKHKDYNWKTKAYVWKDSKFSTYWEKIFELM